MPKITLSQKQVNQYDDNSPFQLVAELDIEGMDENSPLVSWSRYAMTYVQKGIENFELRDNPDNRDVSCTLYISDDPNEMDEDFDEWDDEDFYHQRRYSSSQDGLQEVCVSMNTGDAYEKIGGLASPPVVLGLYVMKIMEDAIRQCAV